MLCGKAVVAISGYSRDNLPGLCPASDAPVLPLVVFAYIKDHGRVSGKRLACGDAQDRPVQTLREHYLRFTVRSARGQPEYGV